jgi:hypothetical protein
MSSTAATATGNVPDRPPAVAVMIAVPALTPRTTLPCTVATAGFELCQVAVPLTFSVLPSHLLAVAVMVTDAPTLNVLLPDSVMPVTVTGAGPGLVGPDVEPPQQPR